MKLKHPQGLIYIPSGISPEVALARTTHLSIGAHPDDLEFMSLHGISACYEKTDAFFTGVIVTDGAGSVKSGPFAGMTPEQMIETRVEEQKEASRIGKYNALLMLHYPSNIIKSEIPFQQKEWIQDIQTLLSLCNPKTIYSHNPFDKHPSHLAVILPLIQLLQSLPSSQKPKKLYACEGWRGLDWTLENDRASLPLVGTDELSEKLNRVFVSQIDAGKNYAEAVRGRKIANATFSDPHSTDPAPQVELALELTDLIHQTSENILPYLETILNRFQKKLISEAKSHIHL
ncbi:MAG: PIG-L family deacetylase [Verrucomicrobiota bacterium]